jgi:hypothetical protein
MHIDTALESMIERRSMFAANLLQVDGAIRADFLQKLHELDLAIEFFVHAITD